MDDSPLNKLAAELRNKIYEEVLTSECDIKLELHDHTDHLRAAQPTAKSLLALTTACKQIRAETLPIFYGVNTFHLSCYIRFESEATVELGDAALSWSRSLRNAASMLRKIKMVREDGLYFPDNNKSWYTEVEEFRNSLGTQDLRLMLCFQVWWGSGLMRDTSMGPFQIDFCNPDVDMLEFAFDEAIEMQIYKLPQGLEEDLKDFISFLRDKQQKKSIRQ